jgi:hypothetical protein
MIPIAVPGLEDGALQTSFIRSEVARDCGLWVARSEKVVQVFVRQLAWASIDSSPSKLGEVDPSIALPLRRSHSQST